MFWNTDHGLITFEKGQGFFGLSSISGIHFVITQELMHGIQWDLVTLIRFRYVFGICAQSVKNNNEKGTPLFILI